MKQISETMVYSEGGRARPEVRDAISALVSLGFAEKESRDAVSAGALHFSSPTVQELIKAALATLKER
jgi:Holliday junction resolvasome RuvABC DNA-binding subunit